MDALSKLLEKSEQQKAQFWTSIGRNGAIIFNALTSFGFGYHFVRMLPFDFSFLTLSVNGLFGGLMVTWLTDVMARIWIISQLRTSESHAQITVARIAWLFSICVSSFMTLVYTIYSMDSALDTEAWLKAGKWSVPIIAIVQLGFWIAHDRFSPKFKNAEVQAISEAETNKSIVNINAEVHNLALEMIGAKIAERLPSYAEKIADQMLVNVEQVLQKQYKEDVQTQPILITKNESKRIPESVITTVAQKNTKK